MKVTHEYKENNEYDVIVCGGGPSGVAAAISASRKGSKTLLIEQGGCLGGFWTQGLLTWLIDTTNKGGLIDEVMSRLTKEADGRLIPHLPRYTADTEKTKWVFEQMCLEAGVKLLYHTFISDAVCEGGKIKHVLTSSKSGHVAYGAKIFVDTTGDGDLGYYAGASFELGNSEGITQPMSMVAQIGGVDIDKLTPLDSRKTEDISAKKETLKYMSEAGVAPSYKKPLIAVLSEEYDCIGLMVNHEYMNGLSNDNLTQGTVEGRAEINKVVDSLRQIGGIWKNLHITSTSPMIGVREGRRISGLYKITKEDVNSGRVFEDGICTVYFNTDVHSLRPEGKGVDSDKYGSSHAPYQIPLRSLISKDIDNLLMGGRCISGDFVAHASYRVAGPAFRTGEVAGLLAAYCANTSQSPKDVKVKDLF